MSVNIQYVGFESKSIVREYNFLVHGLSSEPSEISFSILNAAFHPHGLRFQDAPDICSLKLHRELADSANNPLKPHYRLSETELNDYHDSHTPKSAKGLYPRKPAQSF